MTTTRKPAAKKVAAIAGLAKAADKFVEATEAKATLKEKKAAAEAKLAATKAKLASAKAKVDARPKAEPIEKEVPVKAAAKKVVAKTAKALGVASEPFDLAAAAEEAKVAPGQSSANEVQRAVDLGVAMLKAETEVQRLERELSEAKEAYRKLEMGDLPDLMKEIGLTMFKMPDGSVFELVEDVQCGISEERRPAAHAWLAANNYSGLIKTELKMTFGKDEMDKANEIQGVVSEHGAVVDRKEAIHAARLKSFVKEQLAAGVDIPFDLFGIHPFDRVKYVQPKAKKR